MPTWTGSAVDAAAPEAVAAETGDELAAGLLALLVPPALLELPLLEQPATTRPPAEHSAAAT